MKGLALAALVAVTISGAPAGAARHKDWNGWSFDYDVYGSSGLELRQVLRNGKLVLFQASFPTMRVDYSPGHCNESPFSDLLHTGNMLPRDVLHPTIAPLSVDHNWCGDHICMREYQAAGHLWLEIGITANEGNYIIYQAWYLSDHGHLLARVYSKGEQCSNATHRHHPYWRFDFDVGQASSNSVFVYNARARDGVPPDHGWGPGIESYSTEIDATKRPRQNTMWFVRDDVTRNAVWLVPGHVNGRDDGLADRFANRDVSALLYHDGEQNGPWHSHSNGEYELAYTNGEDISSKDVVLWYVAHFQHIEPLPPFDPAKPCGDPAFPPVFDLKPNGSECNDVFGAGPEIVVVNSPGDAPPVPPFDFDLKVVKSYPPIDECGVNGVGPDGTAVFEAQLSPVPEGDSPTYSWLVKGASTIGPSNQEKIKVQLSSGSSLFAAVTATLLGVSHSASMRFTPDTAQTVKMKEFRCKVIGSEQFTHFIEPLADPLRDLTAQPYTRAELLRLLDFGRQLVDGATGILNSVGLRR